MTGEAGATALLEAREAMREVLTYLADTAANAREANPSCPTVPTHVLCRAVDRLESALRSGAGQGEGGGG